MELRKFSRCWLLISDSISFSLVYLNSLDDFSTVKAATKNKERKAEREYIFWVLTLFSGFNNDCVGVEASYWIQIKLLRLSEKVIKIYLFSGRYVHYLVFFVVADKYIFCVDMSII